VPFWNARDLERELADFQVYYNAARSHASLEGHTPLTFAGGHKVACAELNNVRWVSHCRSLVQLPVAARDNEFQTNRPSRNSSTTTIASGLIMGSTTADIE